MTRRRDMNLPASRAAAIFEAHMARHQARMEQAMAAHQRRIEAMAGRLAEFSRTREQATKAIELRVAELMAAKGRRKPPGGRRRRDEEGGEAVPAVPRPKPKPLTGVAAAPIE
jgi:hypothetical protein